MKKIILSFLICLVSMASMAQKRQTPGSFNERLFNAKVTELAHKLKLSDKQVAELRPVYEQYNKDMIAAWGKDNPAKDGSEAERIKLRMERQQRAQTIRIKYTDRFAKVLTPAQLKQFYQVENDIQKRLRMRKALRHRKSKK